MKLAIEDVRVEGGYAFIFNADQGSPIVAADKNLDITDRVLAKLRSAPAPTSRPATHGTRPWCADRRARRRHPSRDAAARLTRGRPPGAAADSAVGACALSPPRPLLPRWAGGCEGTPKRSSPASRRSTARSRII